MSEAYEPGTWYIEPSDHDGCVDIESAERLIARHVAPDDARKILAAHNNARPAQAPASEIRAAAGRSIQRYKWVGDAEPESPAHDARILARYALAATGDAGAEAERLRAALQAQMTESGHTGDCYARRNPYMDCSESCRIARATLAERGR
jgi:hypothetical protein